MSLLQRIHNNEFWPEVYIYPTSRAYVPLKNFSLKKVDFTDDINLYIHLPFCKRICSYCWYLKIIDTNPSLKKRYVASIIKEIDMYKDIIRTRNIKTLHFWWWTPSLFSPDTIQRIIKKIQSINPSLFITAQEISIEATPDNVTMKLFSAYKKIGINRVSLWIQSLDDKEIALCNRNNTKDISIHAIHLLQKIWFDNVVVDVMIGIEWQTVDSFIATIRRLIKIRPDTVELYALWIMPNTRISVQKKPLMDNKDVYSCYDIGRRLFLAAWYKQDCHNRYALPGRGWFLQEDYNFAGMSTLWFGAWARTYGINIHYRNTYYSHAHFNAVLEYMQDVECGILPVKTWVSLNDEEKMRQYAIYNIEHLDKIAFLSRFGKTFAKAFPSVYKDLCHLWFIDEDALHIRLNAQWLNYRDIIDKEMFSTSILRWERAYRYTINIIIFWFSGSWKSTITNALGKKYWLRIIHPSWVLRNLCEGKPVDIEHTQHNTWFWESKKWVKLFNDRLHVDEPLDVQATKIVLNEVKKWNIIVDSRDLPRLTNDAIKIYLKADMKVRAKRVALRSKISYQESMKILKMKYEKTTALFKKLYAIDITKNREVFDYILETDTLSENEVLKKVCDFLEKKYPDLR